eukprot:1665030-Alexandrium_andersonii.AAC.1
MAGALARAVHEFRKWYCLRARFQKDLLSWAPQGRLQGKRFVTAVCEACRRRLRAIPGLALPRAKGACGCSGATR